MLIQDILKDLLPTKLISLEQLKNFIDTDTDLMSYLKNKYPYFLNFIKRYATLHPGVVKEAKATFTDKNKVLHFLSEKRPDMYILILTHPKGIDWFTKQDFLGLLAEL